MSAAIADLFRRSALENEYGMATPDLEAVAVLRDWLGDHSLNARTVHRAMFAVDEQFRKDASAIYAQKMMEPHPLDDEPVSALVPHLSMRVRLMLSGFPGNAKVTTDARPIETLGQLRNTPAGVLRAIRGFGQLALAETTRALRAAGVDRGFIFGRTPEALS